MDNIEKSTPRLLLLAVGICMGVLAVLPVLVCLGVANVHLRRQSQPVPVVLTEPQAPIAPVSLVEAKAPIAPVSLVEAKAPIRVSVSGEYNNVYIGYTDIGGTSGDVDVTGSNGTTTIYLCAGQKAQVTIKGMNNTILVEASLNGLVSCTNVGQYGIVVPWQ